MNTNCVVCFDTRTLVVSRLFLKWASIPFSKEYDMLAHLTKQHPDFTVIVKVTARRKPQFMPTYNDMLDYIRRQSNAAKLVEEFDAVRQMARMHNSTYQQYTIKYLSANYKKKIEEGRWAERGFREDGSKIIVEVGGKITRPTTVWKDSSYESKQYGTTILKNIVGNDRFSFPKSLYAVRDAIRYFTLNHPNALVLDFFAGSGTTLHAVNLLNSEDGGHRRCILVTNNEVSNEESKTLTAQGYHPGDPEWESLGIARYVTWPRTVCSIEGHDVKGNPLKGTYLGSDRAMADGFPSNAAYFKLGFLDKNSVALGRQFREMLPTLWMKAGAHGPCPATNGDEVPNMLVLPENRFAVLTDEGFFEEFEAAVREKAEIETIFIVTDYESAFRSMIKSFPGKDAYQLYRDYLDNFRINTGRN